MSGTKFSVKIIGILFDPKEKKILVGKNKGEEHFSFVDGELNYHEELDQGLKRVIKAKTGYQVHNLGTVFSDNKIEGEETDTLELYFLCEIKEKTQEQSENVEEMKWIKTEEFEELTNKKLHSRLQEYLKNITG